MTPPAQRMRLADLPRVLLELGPRAGRAALTGAAVRAWCKSWSGGGVALIVLCLAVYLPGLWSIPPVDRDESRFAQASRTMLESGDYIVPRIGETPRLNKPPLIYWLQAVSARVLGDGPGADGVGVWGNGNIWVFRVPSVLCAIGTVLLTWRLGVRMFDPRAGAMGAALLAVSPMVIWDAHQARADQLLVFTTTGAMFALYVCWRRATRTSPERSDGSGAGGQRTPRPLTSFGARLGPVLWLWVFVGLGVLAKGPITLMVVVLTAIALSLASRSGLWVIRLRPLLGLLIVGVMVGPWVYLVAERVGWQTYWATVYEETLGRSTEAKESHWGPPGYHLVLLAVLFWPGSLMTAAASGRAWRRGLGRFRLRNRSAAFLLAWVIPAWLVFEIVATKLPHYTMPLYPAIALLTGRAVCGAALAAVRFPRSLGDRVGALVWMGIGVCGLVGSLGAIVEIGGFDFTPVRPSRVALAMCVLGLIATIVAAGVAVLRARRVIVAHVLAMGAVVAWCWATLAWVLPLSDEVWLSPRVARAVHAITPYPGFTRHIGPRTALVGYQEDSALFLLRGYADRVDPGGLAAWMASNPGGVVVLDAARAPAAAPLVKDSMERRTTISGYNYSIGKRVAIDVYAPRSAR